MKLSVLCFLMATLMLTGCLTTATSPNLTGFSGGGGGGGGGNTGSGRAGKDYFNNSVLPALNANCRSCHNDPRFGTTGPLSIYNYDLMLADLRAGSSPEENEFILRVQNQLPHSGGDRCNGNVNSSPCAELQSWWVKEVADGNGPTSLAPFGQIGEVNLEGVYSGWCIDGDAPEQSTQVEIYLNAKKEAGGVLLGTVQANQPYAGLNYPGNHGFSFSIPMANRDKNTHALFAYCLDLGSNPDGLINSSARNFRLYPQTVAGKNYFDNTLRPAMVSNCNGCHAANIDPIYNYNYNFANFVGNPIPASGGTATSNKLINKASGLNHSGGNRCGNINSPPCSLMQTWWTNEFGS